MSLPFASSLAPPGPELSDWLVTFSDATTQTVDGAAMVAVEDGNLLFHDELDMIGPPVATIPADDGTRTVVSVRKLPPPPPPPVTVVNAATATAQAAAAAEAAADAQQAAVQAAADAQTALDTADGKNRVVYATTDPSGDGTRAGDLWFRRNGTVIVGTWEWDGDTWEPRQFGDAVLDTVTAARIVTGTLGAGVQVTIGDPAGDRIDILGSGGIEQWSAGERTFWLSPGGAAYFAGVLTGRSTEFTEGLTGWFLGQDGEAAFQRLQVFESVTAQTVSASSLFIEGKSVADLLTARPSGLVAQGVEDTLNLQGYTAEKGIAEIGFTAYPGRGYLVVFEGPQYGSSDPAGTLLYFRARYTTDGAAPTVTSPVMREYDAWPAVAGYGRTFGPAPVLWYPPTPGGAAGTPIRLALSFGRATGAGAVGINCTGSRRLQMSVYDHGTALPNSIRINGFEQASPPPAPSAPVQKRTETFYTTGGATYRANGSRWSVNAEGWAYQGWGDSFNGNQMSMHFFDAAYIRSLIGSGTITSAVLYARNGHTWDYGGGQIVLGSHNLAVMPATKPGSGLNGGRAFVGVAKGDWVAVDVLGVMNEIKANASQGFIFGAAPSNDTFYYSKWFQYPHADRPRVVVTWEG